MLNNFKIMFVDGILLIDNIKQSWSDDFVIKEMKILRITLGNNAEIRFNDEVYYGSEDDYRLYFYMTQESALRYLCNVMNGED